MQQIHIHSRMIDELFSLIATRKMYAELINIATITNELI